MKQQGGSGVFGSVGKLIKSTFGGGSDPPPPVCLAAELKGKYIPETYGHDDLCS